MPVKFIYFCQPYNQHMKELFRSYLHRVKGYSSARDEFIGEADIFLDANENPYDNGHNRYPDSRQKALRQAIARLKNIAPESIYLSNGSDSIVDKLIRLFCEPGKDSILINTPTFGMYAVMASINNVEVLCVDKTEDYQLDLEQIKKQIKLNRPKIIFLCSPNNPVSNTLHRNDILQVIEDNPGITVLDEAYIDFSPEESFLEQIAAHPRLIILQTFSKSWALAGLRLGMAFGPAVLTDYLYKISTPYNVNSEVQKVALNAIEFPEKMKSQAAFLLRERKRLENSFSSLGIVKNILPSSTNFLAVEFSEADRVYHFLVENGIVVRNISYALPNHLRITVGNKKENNFLIKMLQKAEQSFAKF